MNRLTRTLATFGAAAIAIVGLAVATPASGYAAPARPAHLTASQATQLQHEVDAVIAKTGGTQTAINEVSIAGADILVPLPGEARARYLNRVVHPDQAGCPYTDFCAYQYQDFTGQMLLYHYCQDTSMPWGSVGSYDNNQTPNTIATFEGITHAIIGYSVNSGTHGVPSFNWTPVWFINPC
jgi:hypothetical protein